MPTTVFLTGAQGYVGRRVAAALARGGARRVLALARRPGAVPGTVEVRGDLTESGDWAGTLRGCDAVVHLAALTGKARRRDYARVNVDGTRFLVAAARAAGVPRFLHVSTIAAAFPDRRHYPYAESKLEAEGIVAAAGVPSTVLRPTIVLGPAAPVLTGLARMACAPRPVVFGPGLVRVQPVHVDDVAEAVVAALDEPFRGEVVELGGPDTVTIEEFLRRIRATCGRRAAPFVHLPLGAARGLLAALEPLLLPLLPLTAGQLSTFANDGVARPHPLSDRLLPRMRRLDAALAESLRGA